MIARTSGRVITSFPGAVNICHLRPLHPYFAKIFRYMAAFAVPSKTVVVYIILLMAGDTFCCHFDLLFYRFGVTGVARKPLVFPFQLVIRLLIMIETPKVPAIRVMTGLTLPCQ